MPRREFPLMSIAGLVHPKDRQSPCNGEGGPEEAFQLEHGSLCRALQRLPKPTRIVAFVNNRKAKYYWLMPEGKRLVVQTSPSVAGSS